jgi:hypothetical protein
MNHPTPIAVPKLLHIRCERSFWLVGEMHEANENTATTVESRITTTKFSRLFFLYMAESGYYFRRAAAPPRIERLLFEVG